MSDYPIQRVARGLQNLLNLFGLSNPQDLSNTVQGTLDLLRHYSPVECIQQVTAAGITGAVGDSDLVVVPATETWVLFGMGFQHFVGAAGQISYSGFVRTFTPSNSFPIYRVDFIAALNDRVDYGTLLPYPLILPPGSTLTTMIERPVTAGIASITSRHLVAKLS